MSWESLLPGAPQSNFYDAFNQGRQVAIADQASQRQAAQWQRDDQVNARNDAILANRQTLGSMLAQGNIAGAGKAALANGDLDYYGRIQELAKTNTAQAAQHYGYIAQAADTLLRTPAEQRPVVFANSIAPQLKGLGVSDAEMGQVQLDDNSLQAYRAYGIDLATRIKMAEPKNVPMDNRVVTTDAVTGKTSTVVDAHPKLEFHTVNNADGSSSLKVLDPYNGALVMPGANGAAPAPGAPGAPGASSAPGGAAGFDAAMAFTLPHEGGFAAHDANGAAVNFGINQGANPDVDVAHLTRDGAKQIYHDKYWVPSGAENLPAAMQVPFFDTYIINPGVAKRLLAQSGNDPQKFMDLREAWQNRLVEANPGKYGRFDHAWTTRNADLRASIGNAPAGVAPAPAGGSAPATAGSDPYSGRGTGSGLDIKGAPTGYAWTNGRTGLKTIPGGPQDDSGSDENSVHDAAVVLIKTGQMPSLGIGGADFKERVLAKQSELIRAAQIDASQLPALRADYEAHKATLKQRVELLGALKPNADTLDRNLAQVAATHQRLVQLGIIGDTPALNQYWLSYYRNLGTPEQKKAISAAEQATTTAANEYAAFMTKVSGGGNAPTSDASRNEAHERIPIWAGPSGMQGGLAQLHVEAKNKIVPYQQSAQAEQAALAANPLSKLDGGLGGARPSARPSAHPAPAVGAVVRGFRFKGGNPADRNSWERAQ